MALHKSFVAVLLIAMVGCSDDGAGGANTPRQQVVLDYSPTLSDADALLYLASNPAVELLAVTLPGTGEADCDAGVRITRALLSVAGQDEVPIGCGRNEPLTGDRDWPDDWRQAASHLGEGVLPVVEPEPIIDAEQLLADTLRAATEPITLVAVGPLTNLGAVFGAEPALAEHLDRIVIMGGAVTVPGNVEASPAAEWNIYIDPEAARIVIASGAAVTFVALDATNHLPWSERLVTRIAALDSAAADTVHGLVRARDSLDGFFLWDELAAMVGVDPSLVTIEPMTVRINDDGAIVRDSAGFEVGVAINTNAVAAMDAFLASLNGGAPAPAPSLTAQELDYFVIMGGADSDFKLIAGQAYAGVDDANPDLRGMADSLFKGFIAAAEALRADIQDMKPPPALRAAHDEYIESLAAFIASRDDLLAAAATADGTDLNELLNNVLLATGVDAMFERVNMACQALVDYSFVRGGPRPCSAGA